jgi:serine-type D-Ala-D-Ala carboxypeptidase (penicillin-binding protein 5/6)
MYKLFKKLITLCLFLLSPITIFAEALPEVVPPSITSREITTAINPNSPLRLIPNPPNLKVKAYILIDAKSGEVMAAKNPDDRLPPASLTKIMSIYLIADALKAGKIRLDSPVIISKKAWRMEGSRMFANNGSMVPVEQLINGIIIASGNDATVAMAEYIGGNEDAFVDLMNKNADLLGMKNTHYMDSNGLPMPNHYSSARDIAILSQNLIANFPEYYPWFKTKWIIYNKIKQPNRNRLLWHDPSVDGIKTGHTKEAGFCLAASAERNGMRLIAVILGALSDAARTNYTEALLNYGFRFFESHKIYAANAPILTPKVLFGKAKTIPLGVTRDLYVTIPAEQYKNIKVMVNLNDPLKAPITKGQVCGNISIKLNDQQISSKPLVALQDNLYGSFFSRLINNIVAFFKL